MSEQINLSWQKGMSFKTEVNGHEIVIDAVEAVGGENKGPRPKPFMMLSLAGCTGMDVVSILKKMRVEPDSFNVKVDGKLTEEHPKHYKSMHLIFEFTGKNLPLDKIKKAIELSDERYCGVSAVYKKAMILTYDIIINGEKQI